MPRHDPMVFMCHMLEYARLAQQMSVGRTRDDLDNDAMFRLALTRAIEVIGEAASHVPQETRAQYPCVPWKVIVGMRHRLIHGYAELDLDLLWGAATLDAPLLVSELSPIVPPELMTRDDDDAL